MFDPQKRQYNSFRAQRCWGHENSFFFWEFRILLGYMYGAVYGEVGRRCSFCCGPPSGLLGSMLVRGLWFVSPFDLLL